MERSQSDGWGLKSGPRMCDARHKHDDVSGPGETGDTGSRPITRCSFSAEQLNGKGPSVGWS